MNNDKTIDPENKAVKALGSLRRAMRENGAEAVIIPSADWHNSEYVNDFFKLREHYSGFDGSAGTLIVLKAEAALWTDGRYFLQAERQLAGTGIDLMKQGEPGVPKIMEYLLEKVKAGVDSGSGFTLFFDGRTFSSTLGKAVKSAVERAGGNAVTDKDLAGSCWDSGRPALSASRIWELPLSAAGMTRSEKMSAVRAEMKKLNADILLISDLMENAWLMDLRASDIACTPVFYSYCLLSQDTCRLYTLPGAMPDDIRGKLASDGIECFDYDEAKPAVDAIPENSRVWADMKKTNCFMTDRISRSCVIIDRPTPVEMMKAVKNSTEIESTKNAHLKDASAVVEFIYRLKRDISTEHMTELSAAKILDDLRYSKPDCFDLSFPTISAYAENGAVIHYEPAPETDKELAPEGFLLVDSGGQYRDGTTDITRTIVLGPLTEKMRKYYTLVLKSHIALETAIFAPGTTGRELDVTARKPLNDEGLDFNHGTGHGVGHVLSVHEGPNIISKHNANCPIVPGMITSDEPGVYIENEFGIRLENEILCVEKEDGSYGFEPLTFVPFDRDAIVREMLTDEETSWLNSYHETVYEKVSGLVPDDAAEWLRSATLPL
jgi:Xaa-Pro aminopeptidase